MFDRAYQRTTHGGWLETAAKLAFVVLVATLAVMRWIELEAQRPPEPPVTAEQRAAILDEVDRIQSDFSYGHGSMSTREIVETRNRLVELRESLSSHDGSGIEHVDHVMEGTIGRAIHEREDAIEDARAHGDGRAIARAMARQRELSEAFDEGIPRNGMSLGECLAIVAWWLGSKALFAYVLFIPFAFVICIARLRAIGTPLADELIYGCKNLLFTAVIWPFGLRGYPKNTALALRRQGIEADYRARVGKTGWRDELSPEDLRIINELVEAPKVELAARLAAIREMPTTLLWQARFAAYIGMIIGFLTASMSFSVRAQQPQGSDEIVTVTEDTTEATESTPPPFELHGFLQAEAGLPDRPLGMRRARLIATLRPFEGLDTRFVVDLLGPDGTPVLRDACLQYAPAGSPFTLRVGQMVNRAVYMLPAPNSERLIDGPAAATLMSFWDTGGEVTVRLVDWASISLEVMTGAGLNRPDDNDAKDVVVSAALGPFGPLRFAAAFQAGEQPDGFRTRAALHAVGEFGPVTVDLLGTYQYAEDDHSLIVSGMVAWRVDPLLDLAVGYDEVHVAGSPDDHVGRAQATLHLLDEHVSIAAMYRGSVVGGHSGHLRLQAGF